MEFISEYAIYFIVGALIFGGSLGVLIAGLLASSKITNLEFKNTALMEENAKISDDYQSLEEQHRILKTDYKIVKMAKESNDIIIGDMQKTVTEMTEMHKNTLPIKLTGDAKEIVKEMVKDHEELKDGK